MGRKGEMESVIGNFLTFFTKNGFSVWIYQFQIARMLIFPTSISILNANDSFIIPCIYRKKPACFSTKP